jgi:hypothetical protein
MFCHGDTVLWGAYSFDFRNQQPAKGVGFLKRLWQKYYIGKVGKRDVRKLLEAAKAHDATTIVCGHIHPREVFDKTYDGIRVIVVPRGITQIDI